MFVDSVGDRVGLGNAHLHPLHNLHGERLLHLHWVGFLNCVWHWLLDDLRDNLVDGYLNRMLDIHMDGVGLRNSDFHIVGDSNWDGMGNWHSDFLVDRNRDVFNVLRVGGVDFFVMSLVIMRGIRSGHSQHKQNGGDGLWKIKAKHYESLFAGRALYAVPSC